MARGRAVYRAQPAQGSIARTVRQLSAAAAGMRRLMIQEMRAAEPRFEAVFEEFAPFDQDERDDMHLVDHIDARTDISGRVQTTVYVTARSPSGFDYLDVTRFGHRGPLRPRQAEYLRWRDGTGWHRALETRGHHPGRDWTEDAAREAEVEADDVADRVGRVVYTRLLS